jgi:putative transposase
VKESSKVPIVDPRVRLAISLWPDKAPRGAVTSFCDEYGISRESFYVILRRARDEGQAAALEPKSRRPKTNPTKLSDDVKTAAIAVRVALEASGLDHGPISVHDKMKAMGLVDVPSIPSLARIFREAGVARKEPKKKPRAAYRRFVYPAPNACWQLDAAEYVITRGRKRTIFQLIDDHSRVAVASLVTTGETAAGALAVVMKGIGKHGVPQRFLSDNGAALNPSRRGYQGQLVEYLESLGVTPITGKPGKPTTQGKNERFHQTLFKFLEKQPLADSTEELQAQVDEFDRIYNNERPHQGLPGRITPQAAWEATPVAQPPRPTKIAPNSTPPQSSPYQNEHTIDGIRTTIVRNDGTIRVKKIEFRIGAKYAGQTFHVKTTDKYIEFFEAQGESILRCPWPMPGTRYVGTKELRKYGLAK